MLFHIAKKNKILGYIAKYFVPSYEE